MGKLTNKLIFLLTVATFCSQNVLAQNLKSKVCETDSYIDKCYGEVKFPNGTIYKGEFSNNKLEGKGEAHYPKGGKYVGEFLNGKRNGQGIYYYPSGNIYRGQWKNGLRDGKGILFLANGETKEGIWLNGELHPAHSSLKQGNLTQLGGEPTRTSSSNCSSVARLILNSSGYSGNIEVQLRRGNRPGSKIINQEKIITSGTKDFPNICPGKYFFSFSTPELSTVSVTRSFSVNEDIKLAQITVFLSIRKSESEGTVQVISKKDL